MKPSGWSSDGAFVPCMHSVGAPLAPGTPSVSLLISLAGACIDTGAKVTRFSPGDRVAVHHHIPCRVCFYCRRKQFSQCEFYRRTGTTAGFEPAGGGFAEYVRVMDWIVQAGTVRIPDDIDFEEATFLEPLNTCLKALETAALQALDRYEGPLIASHANARALIKGASNERQLTDATIRRLIERDGVGANGTR